MASSEGFSGGLKSQELPFPPEFLLKLRAMQAPASARTPVLAYKEYVVDFPTRNLHKFQSEIRRLAVSVFRDRHTRYRVESLDTVRLTSRAIDDLRAGEAPTAQGVRTARLGNGCRYCSSERCPAAVFVGCVVEAARTTALHGRPSK